jgi:hypothetical protein
MNIEPICPNSEGWCDLAPQKTQIVEYLAEIERDRIEFETSDEHRLDIARKAIALVATWRLAVRP